MRIMSWCDGCSSLGAALEFIVDTIVKFESRRIALRRRHYLNVPIGRIVSITEQSEP
jgi:hypothetical protein